MLKRKVLLVTAAALAAIPLFAQPPQPPPQQPPQQQYPPQQPPPQQYPQQQQQYPQQPPMPQQAPPPLLSPGQLDQLVQRIALYPDPLLAQVMTASTYWNEIPDAANWAQQHSYLTGDALAHAIQEDQLPWDPSVLALLPFPSVLDMMARDPGWTEALGNAVLDQRGEVMDSVQRMRQRAYNYGYLRPNGQYNVVMNGPGDLEILPVDPGYVLVPSYNPYVVFAAPRPGFFVGGAITFGPRVFIGGAFAPFGWAGASFGWRTHAVFIDRRPWTRTYQNRAYYVHPYATPRPHYAGPRVEHHEVHEHGRERR